MEIWLQGFLTGLALIVAIGAQNAWVLRQGIRREHVLVVVLTCMLADILLIALGTAFIGVLSNAVPWLLDVLRWGGVVYLIYFASRCFMSAARGAGALTEAKQAGAGSVLTTTLALTFLNPHVYLDTVVMLGTVTNSFGDAKWLAAVGAMTASVLWFGGLGFGARALSGVLAKPRAWQIIDVLIGIVMLLIAYKLAFNG
ncbi:LysE/ArgO family amino acid transporter [Canibacter zhoujuaniae]|uniref:LysE/ArgO family amino acid transporter n=1 Tax=Canibacter zhoujuaniae TaxID=2708343 RepID=UPI001421A66C|nr:LysE/ArgO family amino acid transporter [Canibacter zhoujuaniae]